MCDLVRGVRLQSLSRNRGGNGLKAVPTVRRVRLKPDIRYSLASHGAGFLQERFHAGKTLPARFLRCAGAAPMRFERARMPIAVRFERAELPRPIDDAVAHRLPLPLAVDAARRVLAVNVADSLLRDRRVAARIGHFVAKLRVAGIPSDL